MAKHEKHHDPTWPYDDIEDREIFTSEPTWDCAAGFCVCPDAHDIEAEPQKFIIILCDERAERMKNARCRIFADGILINEGENRNADRKGRVEVTWRRLPEQVLVEWAPKETPIEPRFPFRKLYFVNLAGIDKEEATRRRLHNLGYSQRLTLEDNIRDFQRSYGDHVTGKLADIKEKLERFHDRGQIKPVRGSTARAERSSFVEFEQVAPAESMDEPNVGVASALQAGEPPAPTFECKDGVRGRTPIKNLLVDWCVRLIRQNQSDLGEVIVDQKSKQIGFSTSKVRAFDISKPSITTPAWEFQGLAFPIDTQRNGNLNPADWEYGFVQTVHFSRWTGVYSGGGVRELAISRMRDGEEGADAPWYDATGKRAGPKQLGGPEGADIIDAPEAPFPAEHPDRKGEMLVRVCYDATFLLWLATKAKAIKKNFVFKGPGRNIVLLCNTRIDISRRWQLKKGVTTNLDETNWFSVGSQTIATVAEGAGKLDPVLDGPLAGSKIDFVSTSNHKCDPIDPMK